MCLYVLQENNAVFLVLFGQKLQFIGLDQDHSQSKYNLSCHFHVLSLIYITISGLQVGHNNMKPGITFSEKLQVQKQ